jgi:hypothetical protein
MRLNKEAPHGPEIPAEKLGKDRTCKKPQREAPREKDKRQE